ncbi:MAG: HAD family hydrolase [Anaerolineae bacterium]|nr:HAD family hydrolase [Anaerolineae bacterium]
MSACTSYGERCGARRIALLFDLGDTLMIEESEIKDTQGTTLQADLIPGAAEALRRFREQGHTLALVADARPDTPANVLRQHGLYDLFDYLAISEIIGAEKPEPLIFQTALKALGIPESDYGRVAMVGNNLERDVVGANRLGLISIFFHWNDRRRSQPLTAEEEPRYTVSSIEELVSLIAGFDNSETCEALEPWESS